MSHDWPRGIYHFGNVENLVRRKRFFAQEIEDGTLGSAPTEELLYQLKPDYWFAAHLHVKFAAIVDHEVMSVTVVSLLYSHTHPFNGPFSGTTRVSRYQKGKTNLDFTEARDIEWQWHQLGHMQVCNSLQTDNYASTPPLSFLQAGCPSCRLTNGVKSLYSVLLNKQVRPRPTLFCDGSSMRCNSDLAQLAITFLALHF